MLVPKIVSHAALVVTQNTKDCVIVWFDRKVSNILHLPTFQAAPPTCPLHVWKGGRGQCSVIALKLVLHHSGKTITYCCLATETFSLSQERVGIGRKGNETSSRYCWRFFYQEKWFWNHRLGWRVEAFLFRFWSQYVCSSGCGNSHKPSVDRLCVRLDSCRITGLYVEAQSKGMVIIFTAGECYQCSKRIWDFCEWCLRCSPESRFNRIYNLFGGFWSTHRTVGTVYKTGIRVMVGIEIHSLTAGIHCSFVVALGFALWTPFSNTEMFTNTHDTNLVWHRNLW